MMVDERGIEVARVLTKSQHCDACGEEREGIFLRLRVHASLLQPEKPITLEYYLCPQCSAPPPVPEHLLLVLEFLSRWSGMGVRLIGEDRLKSYLLSASPFTLTHLTKALERLLPHFNGLSLQAIGTNLHIFGELKEGGEE